MSRTEREERYGGGTAADELLTKVQVEVHLRLHRNTVTRLLQSGAFPKAFQAGGRWRIPSSDVEAFKEERRAAAATRPPHPAPPRTAGPITPHG